MSLSKVLMLVCLLNLVLVSNSKVVYRKYERKNAKKNYVQVVEVFETIQKPPNYLETEKDLNDFLGRDSFKSSMNCTEIGTPNYSEIEEFPIEEERVNPTEETIILTTNTPSFWESMTPAITTTTQHTTKTPSIWTTMTPQTTVTERTMKPTIKPNPFENTNPDYTSLYRVRVPDIQVTKHLPNNTPQQTIITIKETDDHPGTKLNTLSNEENNYDTEYTDESTINNNEDPDEVIYDDDQTNDTKTVSNYEFNYEKDDDDDNDEYADENGQRKRRNHSKSLKIKHTTKQ